VRERKSRIVHEKSKTLARHGASWFALKDAAIRRVSIVPAPQRAPADPFHVEGGR
jgi:hypothetical protein